MRMSKPEKKGLVPTLRFVEFKDAGEWVGAKLGEKDISTFVKERIPLDRLTLESYVSTENLLPDYAGVTTASKLPSTGSFTRYKQGDILVSNIRPYLKKVWAATNEGATSNDVIVIRTKSKVKDSFLTYLLRNDEFINYVMKGAKGVKMPRGDISLMKEYPVAIPASPKEQQKIADCLTSVDELITFQTQKLDALKTHKKGLLQQLFPAEGETLPKLRFPEFWYMGEWSSERFGEICKFVRGPFGGALKKDIFVKVGYAVYEQSHAIYENFDDFRYYITKEKYDELKRFAVKSNDLIMSCSGTMGKFAVVPSPHKEGVINQALLKLTVKKGYNLKFIKCTLEHPLNQEKLLSQSAGGAIKNVVGVDQLKEIDLPIPSLQEQQKIADCLSSIDDLITAQTQKLAALKAHKKGLMQQLFPAVDDGCMDKVNCGAREGGLGHAGGMTTGGGDSAKQEPEPKTTQDAKAGLNA